MHLHYFQLLKGKEKNTKLTMPHYWNVTK